MNYKKSPLKWVGGKGKVLEQIFDLPHFKDLSKYDAFVEPFVGGGNIFLNVDHDNIIVSDNNKDLIDFYCDVKYEINEVIREGKQLFKDISEDAYYNNRIVFNARGTDKSALFLYLNKVGFRGLCRYSEKTGFNVSYGHYDTVYFPEKELIELHKKLKNVRLFNKDFEITMNMLHGKNLLYVDPPYVNTFSNYTEKGFSLTDHENLNRLAMSSENDVIISNSTNAKEIYTPKQSIDIVTKRGMGKERTAKECFLIY